MNHLILAARDTSETVSDGSVGLVVLVAIILVIAFGSKK